MAEKAASKAKKKANGKSKRAGDNLPDTPMLDELVAGPWPSFVSGLKRLAESEDQQYAPMMKSLLGQLEHSYETPQGILERWNRRR